MSEAQHEDIDMTTSAAIQTDLAASARRFVSEDPFRAVERFRRLIQPMMSGGNAWVAEPAVLVLLSELRRNKEVWPRVRTDAERLLEDSEDAQMDAVDRSLRALTPAEVAPLEAALEAAAISSPLSVAEKVRIVADTPVEAVQVKWVAYDRKSIRHVFEDRMFDDQTRFIYRLKGLTTAFAHPQHLFRDGARPTFFQRLRRLVFGWQQREIDVLRQRALAAMFYIPPDEAMLVTVFDEGHWWSSTADVYIARVGSSAFERMRTLARNGASLEVLRPIALDTSQARHLAKAVVSHDVEVNVELGVSKVDRYESDTTFVPSTSDSPHAVRAA